MACGQHEACVSQGGAPACPCVAGFARGAEGTCEPECPLPLAPVLPIIAESEELSFTHPSRGRLEIAILPASLPPEEARFEAAGDVLSLEGRSGPVRVLARVVADDCVPAVFDAVYDVRETYAPAPPAEGTTAIPFDDPRIVGWAQTLVSYEPGPNVNAPRWMDVTQALGPAGRDPTRVLVLGNGGTVTLSFAPPISDGEGWDFVVFENAFAADTFLELAYVEVSSDGSHFVRFDSAFSSESISCDGCTLRASGLGGLAGTYPVGEGTPFDLAALRNAPEVRFGAVDLSAIAYVRLVDIVGDGSCFDSFGRSIFDSLDDGPTGGFDLDAVGVLNVRGF